MIKVSVIIPTYHDWERLKICIGALSKQAYPQDKFEVIIVNNDPDDSPPDLSFPENFRIISEAKSGSYAARNAGIKRANGEIMVFTDSDCIPDENWISSAVNLLQGQSDVDLVGGKVVQFIPNGYKKNGSIHYQELFSFNQKRNIEKKKVSVTANLFVRKKVIREIGVFNDLIKSGGDFEFCKRAYKNGIKLIYCDNCIVKHPFRPSISDLITKKKRTTEGDFNKNRSQFSLKYVLGTIKLIILRCIQAINKKGFINGIKVSTVVIILKGIEVGQLLKYKLNVKR